jgi:hypothetical protein
MPVMGLPPVKPDRLLVHGSVASDNVGEGAVVEVAGQELVEAGVVVAEPQVVVPGRGVEPFAGVPVGVVGLFPRVGRVGFVHAGERGRVVVAVGGVAVGGPGVPAWGCEGLDVGVRGVPVIRALGPAGVAFHLRDPPTASTGRSGLAAGPRLTAPGGPGHRRSSSASETRFGRCRRLPHCRARSDD